MRRKKFLECFSVKRALDLCNKQPDEQGYFSCLFCDVEGAMKQFPEINVVSCLNEECERYKMVYDAIAMLECMIGGTRSEHKQLAEEFLIEELEAYRATGIEPVYPNLEDEQAPEDERGGQSLSS
jgi:hypothetical protein